MNSIKGIADAIFGVNPPPKELSLDEMVRYRAKSKEMLQNRIKSGTKKTSGGQGNADLVEIDLPCPKCEKSNWDEFPDGRKYCLECGAIKESDGTITGGAIQKKTQMVGNKIMENIICEFTCNKCTDVIQAKGKDIETAMKKVIPHKAYNPNSQCDGVFTFSRQVSSEVQISVAEKRSVEPEAVIYENKICKHPKRDIFICNRCRDVNNCSQTYRDTALCLLINVDMKLKRLLEKK